jgi:hypothetical protein
MFGESVLLCNGLATETRTPVAKNLEFAPPTCLVIENEEPPHAGGVTESGLSGLAEFARLDRNR